MLARDTTRQMETFEFTQLDCMPHGTLAGETTGICEIQKKHEA